MARSDPRQALLDAVVAYASHHGISNLSLRELAAAVGTSHRMLIYHFGSREQLLVAVVEANETEQRAAVTDALADGDGTALDVLRRAWDRWADPVMWPSERLFFELYGQALQGRPGTTSLLDSVVTLWIEAGSAALQAQGVARADAEDRARLNLAVIRGLLLDLLATADGAGADRAMELYLRQSVAAPDPAALDPAALDPAAPSAH
jgi:AcrR family transcriptional regulator